LRKRANRLDVAQDVLACVGGWPPVSKGEYAGRLLCHRGNFARIATLKYPGGLYTPEVNVLVVRITADDLF
jgi:hypothetical protein